MANRDRYFFDKRIVKKVLMKYLGLFAIAFIVTTAMFIHRVITSGFLFFIVNY